MRITITDDEGEVYVVLTDITVPLDRSRHATGVDEEGDTDTVWSFIQQAARWEQANRLETAAQVRERVMRGEVHA